MFRTPLFKRASSLLLSSLVLTACSGGGSDGGENLKVEPANCEVTGSSFGIVGGRVLGSGNILSESSVLIVHINYKDETSICTGTLVDDDKVLTAAHCISPFGMGTTAIAFTNNSSCLMKAPKRTLRKVVKSASHTDYNYWATGLEAVGNSAHDLAVLKFEGGTPEGYKVRALPDAKYSTATTDTLVMSGYGRTSETDEESSGTLRFTTLPAASILGTSAYVPLLKRTITVEKTLIVDQPTRGVCSGDSGGALYVQGQGGLTLVGVASMGIDNRTEDANKAKVCHGISLFTDVREHLGWIQKQIDSL